jgi:uncharacterized protein (TIGR02246 family)
VTTALVATATGGAPTAEAPAENALYAFIAALSDGNLRGAAACFTREGCMITPDGTAVHGRSEVVAILSQLVARRTEIEVEQLVLRQAGDVALATGRLTLRSDGPEGARIEQSCKPTLALRRVEERWKIAILAPWASNFPALM